MAYKTIPSFLTLFLISSILLATTLQALARCNTPQNPKTQDKKEPEWLFHHDGHIPGFGHVKFPPKFGFTPNNPYTGGNNGGGFGGGSGAGSAPGGRSYVPGGDDTFVPNPGFEVPNPGSGGGGRVPVATHP